MQGINIAVVARSANVKTGDIPTVWVGRSLAESRESCAGCPLLASGDCYAQYGSPSFAIASVRRAASRAKSWRRYTIHRAIANRAPSARFVRFSALGDVAGPRPAVPRLKGGAAGVRLGEVAVGGAGYGIGCGLFDGVIVAGVGRI